MVGLYHTHSEASFFHSLWPLLMESTSAVTVCVSIFLRELAYSLESYIPLDIYCD